MKNSIDKGEEASAAEMVCIIRACAPRSSSRKGRMSCVGVFWSLLWGKNVTVGGETYRVLRRIGEGGKSAGDLHYRSFLPGRILLRGVGTQARAPLCAGECSSAFEIQCTVSNY